MLFFLIASVSTLGFAQDQAGSLTNSEQNPTPASAPVDGINNSPQNVAQAPSVVTAEPLTNAEQSPTPEPVDGTNNSLQNVAQAPSVATTEALSNAEQNQAPAVPPASAPVEGMNNSGQNPTPTPSVVTAETVTNSEQNSIPAPVSAALDESTTPKNILTQSTDTTKNTMALESRLFVLKYVKPKDVIDSVKKVLSERGGVETFDLPNKDSTSIYVHDFPDQLAKVEKLLQDLDVPVAPIKVTVNFSNASLLDVLRSLSDDTHINIIAGKDVTGSVTVHLVDVPLERALNSILISNGYTYVKEDNVWRVIPIASTAKVEEEVLTTQVFVLKYANAEDLKEPLGKLISKNGLIQVFSHSKDPSDKSKARSNKIIIRDNPEVLSNISSVIQDLDKESSQVLIEAKFINVQLDNSDEHGVDWAINASLNGSVAPTTFPLYNTYTNGHLIPKASATDTNFNPKAMFPYATNSNFTFGSLDFSKTQAVLQMLEKTKKTQVISAPRVSTMDGEEAMINVGKNYPIPTYEHSSQTGVEYISGYQEEKVGIILRVTPYLVGENRIMLNLHPEVSDIFGFVGPNNERPVVSISEVSTNVSVVDGGTIIIGGMIRQEVDNVDSHVPLLGSIPFFGAPFHYKSKVTSKTELLIFLTPHIISKDSEKLDSSKRPLNVEEESL